MVSARGPSRPKHGRQPTPTSETAEKPDLCWWIEQRNVGDESIADQHRCSSLKGGHFLVCRHAACSRPLLLNAAGFSARKVSRESMMWQQTAKLEQALWPKDSALATVGKVVSRQRKLKERQCAQRPRRCTLACAMKPRNGRYGWKTTMWNFNTLRQPAEPWVERTNHASRIAHSKCAAGEGGRTSTESSRARPQQISRFSRATRPALCTSTSSTHFRFVRQHTGGRQRQAKLAADMQT